MASAEEPGNVELIARREGGNSATVFKAHTNELSAGAKTVTDNSKLGYPIMSKVIATKGSKLDLVFSPDAADVVESEESAVTIPILRNGNSDTLTLEDFSGFAPSAAVDKTFTNAADRMVLGTYTVPDGDTITFNTGRKAHVYIGDDTA